MAERFGSLKKTPYLCSVRTRQASYLCLIRRGYYKLKFNSMETKNTFPLVVIHEDVKQRLRMNKHSQ